MYFKVEEINALLDKAEQFVAKYGKTRWGTTSCQYLGLRFMQENNKLWICQGYTMFAAGKVQAAKINGVWWIYSFTGGNWLADAQMFMGV